MCGAHVEEEGEADPAASFTHTSGETPAENKNQRFPCETSINTYYLY